MESVGFGAGVGVCDAAAAAASAALAGVVSNSRLRSSLSGVA